MKQINHSFLLAGVYDLRTISSRDIASSVVFSRVGAVGPNEAKIVIRYPEIENGMIRVLWRQADSTLEQTWNPGPLVTLQSEKDWVGVVRLAGLWPRTNYEYCLAFENSTILPYPPHPIPFRTFPDPTLSTGSKFKFIASSCILPNFPYLPFQNRRIKGFDLLSQYIESHERQVLSTPIEKPMAYSDSNIHIDLINSTPPSIEFILLLGDFIYADVPQYGGYDLESYRRLYRRVYASPSFRKVYERHPILNIFDDHEFYNDFAGNSSNSTQVLRTAPSAYSLYNGQANYDPMVENEHYYTFRYGDVAFFVLDTRLHRTPSGMKEHEKTMLGEQQLASLREWLQQVNSTATFKFIVSSVPFTSLWTVNGEDTWRGYIKERNEILAIISTIPNIYIISGDRHEFAAIEYMDSKVVEFSTSPLSMFYIPILRSLKKQSKRLGETPVLYTQNEEGTVLSDVNLPQERVLKYLPLGNFKWTTFEVDTTDHQMPTLKVETVINGKAEWRHSIFGEAVDIKPSKVVSSNIAKGLKDALGKIGLSPEKWF
ncbi:hypothetical protein Clacol_006736 [Clathrus columnatus]|uniref:PhoD-like phosphatase metallophosphatase domain-containing protein n=1 Tax=Clathrus columnatus TaxID=1419009 RepID=A0AAV5ACW8_9AGAM|nr:hypothetical protein Clacol_006736 [Clathrus columnatus]